MVFPSERLLRALFALLLLTAALAGASRADAAGTPDLALSVDTPALALAGADIDVTLEASTPAASVEAHNVSYRVVIPGGSSYVTGSADPVAGEPTIVSNQPISGQTTLLWRNLADLAGGTTHALHFRARPSTSTFGVNTSFTLTADVYASDDPRYVPAFTVAGQHDAAVAHPSTASDVGSTSTTQLRAMEITESATNQPDGELLRGVHDHQSIVTLTLRGTSAGPTSGIVIDHYLPAGLEYLGCGGAGADHTTNAATNPGHTEEYSGAGAIAVPTVSGCAAPASVTTGTFDPPGAQPSGIYTRLRWPLGSLAQGGTQTYPFAVAIPLRANTVTWTAGAPSTAGGQAANLDNNSGAEIADETTLTDATSVTGQFVGIVSTSTQQDTSRTAEDLALSKTSSSGAVVQQSLTQWDLTLRTSEYRSAADVVVTDSIPNGLCPLDPDGNLLAGPSDPSDIAECDTGTGPTDPYASAVEQLDGTVAVSWDVTSNAAYGELGPSTTRMISYTTRTRARYQSGYHDGAPVLAGDTILNTASVEADARVVCANGDACPPGAPTGTEIDHTGALTAHITDDAQAELTGGTGAADNQVALSGTNCSTAAYTQGIPAYAPGDRVCWLVRIDAPAGVDASATQIADYLPDGLQLDTTFGAGGDEVTANDDVGASTFDGSAAIPGPGGALTWTLPSAYAAAASTFEHRIATRLQLPSGGTDGMLVENVFRASLGTTQGTRVPLRDVSDVQLRMPTLAIAERITGVDGTPITTTASRTVRGGEVLTYRLRVTNSGGRDAEQLEVWDRLPAGLTCSDVVALSPTGACAGGVVTWGHTPAIGPTAPAAGATDLTFDLLVPTTVEVGQALATTSGVRQYQSTTNTGGAFTYVPASNVDASLSASANAAAVSDAATITGATPTITESRDTSLTEAGNTSTTATIGETVSYTVSATVPAGLTVRQLAVTDAIDTRHTYVSGTLQQTGGPATTLGMAGSTITLALPSSYTAPTGADTTFTFTFDTLVADASANTRGGATLANQALLTYTPFGTANGGTQTQLAAPQQITSIVEPALALTKQADVGITPVIGGQIVQYTVTLSTGAGTAHESTLVDHVPTGTTPLDAAGDPITDGGSTSDGGVWDEAARTLTFSPNTTITTASPQTFIYKASVNIPVTGGTQLTNTVNATTSSLPGVVAAERTQSSPVTAGYTPNAAFTLNVRTATVVKTSDVTTRNPGERVLYTVDVTIPANIVLHDVLVRDTVPDAVDVDGYEPLGAASCLSGCTPGNEPTLSPYTPVVGGDGTTTVAWDLGDLLVQEPTTRTIRLQYRAHLRATHRAGGTNVVRGQTTTNSVRVMSNRTDQIGAFNAAAIPATAGFDDTSAASNRTLTVVEPGVSLDKQLAVGAGAFGNGPVTVHDGDTLAYKVVITNTGNAPLYDVAVRDTPDAGLRNVQLAAGITTTASTDGFSAGDPQMLWLVPGPIAAGSSVTLQYTADLPVITSLTDAQHLDNSAQVTASWGVPSATRIADGFIYRSYATATDTTRANYDAPSLTLSKTTGGSGFPNSAQAEVGLSFPWRVVVTNTSTTETATQLTIRDTLPPNWRYVPGSGLMTAGGAVTPSIVSESAGDQLSFATGLSLAPGATRVLTYGARPILAAATTPGTGAGNPHINTAQADVRNAHGSTGDAGGLFQSSADTAQAVLAVPALGVDVTPDAGSAAAGSPLTFHVNVTNAGAVGMTNVHLQATFPSGAPYTPGAATASPSTGFTEPVGSATAASWSIASIAAGASVDLTVPVATDPSTAAGTQLVLTVDGSSDQTTGTITDDGDVTLTRSADLAASITATPNPATAGAGLTYAIGATNAGPSSAQDVALSMVLPATVAFQSAPAACAYTSGTRTVACSWSGDLAPAASVSAQIAVTVDPSATTNANATVHASSADPDPSGPNDAASVTVPIGTSADLRLTKTASAATVAHGGQVTFTLRLDDDGPSDAAAARVVDTLPVGLSYVSDDGGCSAVGQVVTCPAATLASGASRTVHVVAQGDVTGPRTNSGTATTTTSDPDGTNNAATASVTVLPASDLQLTLNAPATIDAGGTATATLTLLNAGPDAATAVAITATLPVGTSFAGGDPGCTASGRVVTCAVGGGLASGASISRQLQVTFPTALGDQLLTTTAAATAAEADPTPAADSAPTQVGRSADLSVSQGGDTEVIAGGDAHLSVTVSNAGPSPATNVEVTSELPAGATVSSVVPRASSTCSVAGTTVTCTIASLPAGQSATFGLTVGVPSTWAGRRFTTQVTARSSTPDPNGANASGGRDTVVKDPPAATPPPEPTATDPGTPNGPVTTPAPGKTVGSAAQPRTTLTIKHQASTTRLRGGSMVTYTLTITNTGTYPATGVRACDRPPPGISFPSPGSGFVSGSELCFRTKVLAPGKRVIEKVQARVSRRAKRSSILVNRASVEAENAAMVSATAKGKVVTDGRVKADTVKGFTG